MPIWHQFGPTRRVRRSSDGMPGKTLHTSRVTVTGTQAQGQHGVTEIHGGLLDRTWKETIHERGVKASKPAKICLQTCVRAESATTRHVSMITDRAVFGRSRQWPQATNEDDVDKAANTTARGTEGGTQKAIQMLTNVSGKLKRAIIRRTSI